LGDVAALSPAVNEGMVIWSNLAAVVRKFMLVSGVASVSSQCSGDLGVSPPDEAWSTSSLRGVENRGLFLFRKGVGGSCLDGDGGRLDEEDENRWVCEEAGSRRLGKMGLLGDPNAA